MIYLYDNAIVKDLEESFNPDKSDNPVVKVISPEQIINVAAQVQNDEITFPFVCLERNQPIEVIHEQVNFTKSKKGVPAVFETESNNIYYERAIPIDLAYTLSVFTTNQVDMDEIMREIYFKYLSTYFLSIKIPYESKRDISFGVVIDKSSGITNNSGSSEYSESGSLYQSSIVLKCEGCVLLHYTPQHLKVTKFEVTPE